MFANFKGLALFVLTTALFLVESFSFKRITKSPLLLRSKKDKQHTTNSNLKESETKTEQTEETEEEMNQSYHNVLKRLFKPLVTASRHSVGQLFEIRKSFFQNILFASFKDKRIPKIIHVAGTKGKGSTVEYISAAIRNYENNKVGIFTSPHLHTPRERFKISTNMISVKDFTLHATQALKTVESTLAANEWTVFFDYLVIMAITYFAEKDVNYIVLETGIGGRYDSTNFIDNPEAVVITRIGLDHQNLLGETIRDIAWQKAGIIKPNTHVFTPSTQLPEVLEVFREECKIQNAVLHEVPVESDSLSSIVPSLMYDVQIENACLSAAVLNHLQIPLQGMSKFYWPCRMEAFEIPLTSSSNKVTVVIDGSHNGESVSLFLRGVKQVPAYQKENSFHLCVFGAGAEKNVGDMINEVIHISDAFYFVQASHFKAISEMDLRKMKETLKINNNNYLEGLDLWEKENVLKKESHSKVEGGTVKESLISILQRLENNDKKLIENLNLDKNTHIVLSVCGSLFVAAEAREALFKLYPNLFTEDDWVRDTELM